MERIDVARRLGALARPGSREPRAVVIPAFYNAWRLPKCRKKRFGKKSIFWGFGNQFFVIFLGFWRESAFFSVKIIFLVKFCSRCTYSEVRATKKLRKSDLCCENLASASHLGVYLGGVCRQLPANIRWWRIYRKLCNFAKQTAFVDRPSPTKNYDSHLFVTI